MIDISRIASNWLEQFPRTWRFLFKVYGMFSVKPEKIKYKKRASVLKGEKSHPAEFEVIFDAQCLQTLTRQRGIGKYSLSLIESVCRAAPQKEFAAYLTNIADRTQLEIATNLLKSLKCSNLTVLIFNPFNGSNKISFWQSQEFLRSSLRSFMPKVVVSLNNFEKPMMSIPLPQSLDYGTAAILYDLIPLQFPDQLLISRRQTSTYLWLLSNLQKFDCLLSISNTTKTVWQDLVSNSPQIEVIRGAGYLSDQKELAQYSDRNGVLCIGAEQKHKNLENLICAYSRLPANLRANQRLTIVGIRSNGARKKLTKFGHKLKCEVDLPKYLTDDELRKLYISNRVLVMPSLSEGLSLPILEAWTYGLPAIGSSGTVAEELIQNKMLLFDASDTFSIANRIEVLLRDKDEWEKALLHSLSMSEGYRWAITANLTLKVISELSTHE